MRGEPKTIPKPKGWRAYAVGAAFYAAALALTSSSPWLRGHFPYSPYLVASLATCYVAGVWPANLVAALAAATAYLAYSPAGLFATPQQTPAGAAVALFALLLLCNGMLGSLKASRDRLDEERRRCLSLAESRDVLYRELQHRVSNNIQIIAGLLRLQGQAVADRAAKRALTEASARIGLIARIQSQLQDRTGRRAPFGQFARELLTDAIAASGAEGVTLEVEGGAEPLAEEQATPVSLVMLECVNNALEHAFGQAGGRVRVSLGAADGLRVLTVADDGRGLPPGFDAEGGSSLGLKIVRTMASQIEGRFSIAPGGTGTVCRLEFPALEP